MNLMKRCAALLLTAGLCLSAALPAAAAGKTFADVPTDHWAYSYIEQAYSGGAVAGTYYNEATGLRRFSPEATLTMAEFITMMVSAFYPGQISPSQTQGAWYTPYEAVAQTRGLLANVGSYSMNSRVSRYQMAIIICNLLQDKGVSMPDAAQLLQVQTSIGDWSSVPGNYQDAVATVYSLGIIAGMDAKGSFNGDYYMTRAQSTVVYVQIRSIIAASTPQEEPSTNDGQTGNSTPAEGVKATVGKDQTYPTWGRAETANANGYHTLAQVDIGSAALSYELLTGVNKARAQVGRDPLRWVIWDEGEEYTLLRAKELSALFSQERPGGAPLYGQQLIYTGGNTAQKALDYWLDDQTSRSQLLTWDGQFLCAARCGNSWTLILFTKQQVTALPAQNNYGQGIQLAAES